jgi:hypothetical protein
MTFYANLQKQKNKSASNFTPRTMKNFINKEIV